MEFGRHIGKGIWAFADKALPAISGLGYVFLVIRVLPEHEFGAYGLLQSIFTIATMLAYAFALQPMMKFVAEGDERSSYIAAGFYLQSFLLVIVTVLVFLFLGPLTRLLDPDKQADLSRLFIYLPVLFLVSMYRNFAVSLLQARYRVQRIFWIDAVYFLGILLLFAVYNRRGLLRTAEDVVIINLLMYGCSSVLAVVMTWKDIPRRPVCTRVILSEYWNFGKYTFGGSAMMTAYSQLDVFFVSSFAGVVAVAIYNAAKVLNRLFDMVSQVVQMFLVPYSSNASAKNDLRQLTVVAEKTICFSTILLFPVFIVMFFFPEQLLSLLYSGKYNAGAGILRVLSFSAFITPWNAVIASFLVGTGRVRQGFISMIILAVLSLLFYWILTPLWGSFGTCVGLVMAYIIVTAGLAVYIRTIIPLRVINVLRRVTDIWTYIRLRISAS